MKPTQTAALQIALGPANLEMALWKEGQYTLKHKGPWMVLGLDREFNNIFNC